MAHHHRATDQSSKHLSVNTIEKPAASPLSEGVAPRETPDTRKTEGEARKAKSWLDFEIAGFPWQFVLIGVVIAGGVIGLVLKTAGLF